MKTIKSIDEFRKIDLKSQLEAIMIASNIPLGDKHLILISNIPLIVEELGRKLTIDEMSVILNYGIYSSPLLEDKSEEIRNMEHGLLFLTQIIGRCSHKRYSEYRISEGLKILSKYFSDVDSTIESILYMDNLFTNNNQYIYDSSQYYRNVLGLLVHLGVDDERLDRFIKLSEYPEKSYIVPKTIRYIYKIFDREYDTEMMKYPMSDYIFNKIFKDMISQLSDNNKLIYRSNMKKFLEGTSSQRLINVNLESMYEIFENNSDIFKSPSEIILKEKLLPILKELYMESLL